MAIRANVLFAFLVLAGATQADEALAPGTPFRTEADFLRDWAPVTAPRP